MRRTHLVLTSLAAGLALAWLIYLIGFTGSKPAAVGDRAPNAPPSGDRPSNDRPSEGEAAPPPSPRPSTDRDSIEEPDDPSSEPPSPASTEPSQMRRALQAKFGSRADAPAGEPARSDPPPELPREYVTDVVRKQIIPLAQSCYVDLAKGASGKMTMSVSVIGDADVGSVVDYVEVDHTEESVAGDMTECIREAAYALEFRPPEQGEGVSEFTFSISFSPD